MGIILEFMAPKFPAIFCRFVFEGKGRVGGGRGEERLKVPGFCNRALGVLYLLLVEVYKPYKLQTMDIYKCEFFYYFLLKIIAISLNGGLKYEVFFS